MLTKIIIFLLEILSLNAALVEYKEGNKTNILQNAEYKNFSKDISIENIVKEDIESFDKLNNSKILIQNQVDKISIIKFDLKNDSKKDFIVLAGSFINSEECNISWKEGEKVFTYPLSNFIKYSNNLSTDQNVNIYNKIIILKQGKNSTRRYFVSSRSSSDISKTTFYTSSIEEQMNYKRFFDIFNLIITFVSFISFTMFIYFFYLYKKNYYLYFALSYIISHLVDFTHSLNNSYKSSSLLLNLLNIYIVYRGFIEFFKIKNKYLKNSFVFVIFGQVAFLILSLFKVIESNNFMKLNFHLTAVNNLSLLTIILYMLANRRKEKFPFLFLISLVPNLLNTLNNYLEYYLNFTLYNSYIDVNYIMIKLSSILILPAILIFKAREQQIEIDIAENNEKFITTLRGSSTVQDIIHKMIINIRKYIDYDNVIIYAKDDTTYHLLSQPLFKISARDLEEITKLVNKVPRDELLLTKNISEDSFYSNYINSSYYSSCMIVPLSIGDDNLGSVIFLSSKYSTYSANEIRFTKDFAYRAAVMMDHHKKIKIINKQKSKIAVDESMRLFQQLINTDLKGPMVAVRNGVKTLRETYERRHGALEGDLKEYIDCMGIAVSDAITEVEECLSIISEKSEKFDISFFYDAVENFKKICHFEDIDVEVLNQSPVNVVKGPQKALRNALRLVLRNAMISVRESEKEDTKTIKVDYEIENSKLKISIWDNGIGMKEDELDRIFDLFIPGKEGLKSRTLMVVKSIVERSNGYLNIRSEHNKYTLVELYLDILVNKEIS